MHPFHVKPRVADVEPEVLPKRMLVVDDLPEICMLFRDIHRRIRPRGVELVTETNAARAIHQIERESFDLVLSDLRMRPLDGIHVLAAARKHHRAGHRVLMTAYNEIPASAERIRSAQIDAYLQKPLHTQEVLLLLVGFLRGDAGLIDECRQHARGMEAAAFSAARPWVMR